MLFIGEDDGAKYELWILMWNKNWIANLMRSYIWLGKSLEDTGSGF